MKDKEQNTVKEEENAIWIANKALDVPNADPDDDLRTISRQFLRSKEENAALRSENEKLKASLNEMIEYSEKSQYEKDREHYSIIETKRRNAKSLLQSPVPPEEKPIPEDYYIKGESQTL